MRNILAKLLIGLAIAAALAFLGLSNQNLAKLPTTWLLVYVHQRVAPRQTIIGTLALDTSDMWTGQTGHHTRLSPALPLSPCAPER